jgi:hypothetical protein
MPVTIDELQVDLTPPPAPRSPTAATVVDEAAHARQLNALLDERERIRARLVAD